MATDLRGVNSRPDVTRITLGGSDVLTLVQLPTWIRRVAFYFVANPGKVAYTGTDGAAIGPAYETIPANSWHEVDLRHGADNSMMVADVYLASATGSTVVEVEIS